ncbi:MAG: TetR/AcrR family transcriptional regulator [Kutzneria sp.]|nr:TetR/AcrR family transcriptional regulator [Kutzneria sp.]MBV9846269.1 TetR/AcrR family transcriptional regulator [Kutzneria sp.]
MSSAQERRPGRPARLSRDAIVGVAERIVTAEGVAALTIRRVATELDSSPMAIYRHVRDKGELLALLLDRAAARVARPRLPASPRRRLLTLWRLLHDQLAEQPWVVEALARSDLMGSSIVWLLEAILAAFVACGLTPSQSLDAYRAVWRYTVGTLTLRHGAIRTPEGQRKPSFRREVLAAADPHSAPTVAGLAESWDRPWPDYESGLTALLDGLLAHA